MPTSPNSVTCAERVRMNAIAGLLFVVAGDGLIAIAILGDKSGSLGSYITGICGFLAIILGFYYILCFLNKAISVSKEGIVYRNWMGKSAKYSWDQASASFHPGRNAYFTFVLDGKKITFYGYAKNAEALYDFLYDNELFDKDTMDILRKAAEKEAERVREMQKKAREHESQFEDDER